MEHVSLLNTKHPHQSCNVRGKENLLNVGKVHVECIQNKILCSNEVKLSLLGLTLVIKPLTMPTGVGDKRVKC